MKQAHGSHGTEQSLLGDCATAFLVALTGKKLLDRKKTTTLLVGRCCLTDLMQLRFYLTLTNGCAIRGERLMENGIIGGASLFGKPSNRCCANDEGEGEGEDEGDG